MAKFAVIEDGSVKNIIEGEDGYTLPGVLLVDVTDLKAPVGKDYTYNGVTFTPPAPSPPTVADLLRNKIKSKTATLDEVQEFISLLNL